MDEHTSPAQDFAREQPLMPDDWKEGEALTLPEPSPAEAPPPAAEPEEPSAPIRDFSAEAEALLSARPELRGKTLPDSVTRAAIEQGVPLLQAYLDHEQAETRAELIRLREENRIYRQNEEAARRSPVQGVAGSGSDDAQADPFLTGFTGSGW